MQGAPRCWPLGASRLGHRPWGCCGATGTAGSCLLPRCQRGYRCGAVRDDNQSSLLSARRGVRAGWGWGRSLRPHSLLWGPPGDGGSPIPVAPLPGFVSAGPRSHPPNLPEGPFPPRGAANPPETGRGIVDRAAISLEQASPGPTAAVGLRATLSLPHSPGTRAPALGAPTGLCAGSWAVPKPPTPKGSRETHSRRARGD